MMDDGLKYEEDDGTPIDENSSLIRAFTPIPPKEDFGTIQQLAVRNLTSVIAIDSTSDEQSQSIPSTEGQRRLAEALVVFFERLDFAVVQDSFANVLVTIPSNLPAGTAAPKIALMVHLDTSHDTIAVNSLEELKSWDGSSVPYPANENLSVSVDNYLSLEAFVGQDILFGPGKAPVGLDDKVGMSELMTLGQLLANNPDIPHGEIILVFRPDEEIGRMEAVEGLAKQFEQEGVSYGYTVDGIAPFEISIENFNASQASVTFEGSPLTIDTELTVRYVDFAINGVTTHGDTAKEEGHLNALTVIGDVNKLFADDPAVIPVHINSDAVEANARVTFALLGKSSDDLDALQKSLTAAVKSRIAPHAFKGAAVELSGTEQKKGSECTIKDTALAVAEHLGLFLASDTVSIHPLLPEDSDGHQGYSNPFTVSMTEDSATLHYRLRDFDPHTLKAREQHIRQIAEQSGLDSDAVIVSQQYINMGPVLMRYPELVSFAQDAAAPISDAAHVRPIRGGTGVDPFVERDIPIANLGTGYWAPESEKELTSRQAIANSTVWLLNLVQRIALESE